ncbi:MAG TPA: GNAT family protein [Methylomirabilota bacterium]|jgi:RimJ/RimL family protein N-acetyltransferase
MTRGTAIRVHEALTSAIAPAVCAAARDVAATGPGHVWIDLEDVKVTDVVGLAATLQTCRFLHARGARVSVMPSAAVHRALLGAAILDELPLERPGVAPCEGTPIVELRTHDDAPAVAAATTRLDVRPPAWDELELIAEWAKEPLLDEMVGSSLLYLCRHLGPYHPEVVAHAQHDPRALTLIVHPRGGPPAGFVRLYGVNLAEGFGFLETALVDRRALRTGLGIEASRLVVAWAMDALGLRRVEAKVYAYNVLSVNSLRRNGFTQEGVLRRARTWVGRQWDILVFAILEEEMRRQRAREGFPHMGYWPRDDRP